VAVLVRSQSQQAMEFLRRLWDEDPEHRQNIAMGLAQFPNDENWDYLIRSLPIVEGDIAVEVLTKLRKVDFAPEDPEYFRQVILRGLELKDHGAAEAASLLSHWTGEKLADADASWEGTMQAWQDWFTDRYPELPAPVLPVSVESAKWKFDELLDHLTSEPGSQG